jgi:integrase
MSQVLGRASGHVQLVVRKRGPRWYAKYRLPDGRQVQKLLGPAWTERSGRPPNGYLTKKSAEAALRAILTDAERGTLAAQQRTGVTFADAAAEYLRYVKDDRQRRASTVADYRGVIDGYLIPQFANLPVEAVSVELVDGYRAGLVDEGRLSARTINRHLVVLHGIFKRAARVWGLSENPAAIVERQPNRYSGDFSVLQPDEVGRLAETTKIEQDRVIYLTAAYTGLRQGELLALRWRDIDHALQRVHVRRSFTNGAEHTPKSGKVRSVPLIPELVEPLRELRRREHFVADEDLVFVNDTGTHVESFALRRRFYRDLKSAGLDRLRFHDLRHTFGSLAVQVFPLPDVMAMMGHAHISTTMRYVHHTPGADDAARLSRALSENRVPNHVPN